MVQYTPTTISYQPPAAVPPASSLVDDLTNLQDGYKSYQSVADPNTSYRGGSCPVTSWQRYAPPAPSAIPCGTSGTSNPNVCWKW